MRRGLRAVLLVLVALAAFYLIAANVVLMTSLGPSLASSDRSKVAWRTGYTIVPSRVHLRDLAVQVRGDRARWTIRAARTDATVSLLPLLSGRIEARSAELDDVTIAAEDVAESSSSPTPPARDQRRPPPIAVGARADRKTSEPAIRIRDVVAHRVRDVAIGPIRFRGSAEARGGFTAWSEGMTTIEHAATKLSDGEVSVGGARVLDRVKGDVSITSQSIARDEPALRAWLGATDGGVELTADVVGLPEVSAASWVAALRGSMRTSLRIQEGRLAPQSTASIHVPPAATVESGRPFSADVVLAVGDDRRATLTAILREPSFGDERAPLATASEARVRLLSSEVLLADPLHGATGTVDISGARVDPTRVPLLARFWSDDSASIEGGLHLVVTDGALSGRLRGRAPDAEISLGDVSVRGRLDVDATLRAFHLGSSEMRLDARIEHGAENDPPLASVELSDAVLHLGPRPSLDGTASFRMRDAHAAIDALTGRGELPPLVAAIASTQPIDGRAELHATRAKIALQRIEASAGIVSVRGEYERMNDAPPAATLLIEAGPFSTGVRVEGGATTLVLADAPTWFERERAEASAATSSSGR